ncbi:MAG: hypothetical protein GC162_20200 [Planctomycetes bacterium]|nr:hypothetical protein [Planctomycetota bacterium]
MTRKHDARRSGYALLTAVMMIAVVGLAVSAMTGRMVSEAKSMRRANLDAELRQLLIVGASASPRLLIEGRPEDEPTTLAVPTDLIARGGTVKVRVGKSIRNLETHIEVEASLDGRSMRQTLVYLKGQGGWGLSEAWLEEGGREGNDQRPNPNDQ